MNEFLTQDTSYGSDKKLRVHDVATAKSVKEFDLKKQIQGGDSFMDYYLAFLPSGRSLLLKDGREATVHLLDLDRGEEIRAFRHKGQHLLDVALSYDAKKIAVAEDSGTVKVLEVATGKELLALNKLLDADGKVAFAPDGNTLATGDTKGDVRIWDAATGKLLQTLQARMDVNWTDKAGKKHVLRDSSLGGINSLGFSPDGRSLVASHGYWMVFWDPSTGKEIRRVGRYSATKVSFLPDGKSLLVGGDSQSSENMISILDAKTGEPHRVFDGHHSSLKAVAFSPDGHYVATCEEGPSDEVRIWERTTGRVVFQDGFKHRGWADALAFSPKGDILAAGHVNEITFWDWKNGKLLQQLPAKYPQALAFARDGTKLASCDRDGTIRVRDWMSGKEFQNFHNGTDAPTTVIAFAPDLNLAASTDYKQGTIRLWNLATGKEWKRFQGGGGNWLGFSSDGRSLLQTDGTKRLQIWEIATGERRRSTSTPGVGTCAAFSADGRHIAMGIHEISPRGTTTGVSRLK